MATQDEFVTRVMHILDPSGAGQPVDAEDAELVKAYLPKKLLELAYRDIIVIDSPDDIPDEVLEWVATSIANDLSPDFIGTPSDVNVAAFADRMIKLTQVKRNISRHVRAEFF